MTEAMPSTGLLLAAAAALLLVVLALKLRGPHGPRDLTGPPKRRKRRIGLAEGRRLRALIAAGDGAAALRLIRELGHDEAKAQRLLSLAERLEALSGPADRPPDAGWTEALRSEGGLTYGRSFDYNEALHDQDARGKRGELAPTE
jgi:uncharacterized protein YceH (UPF0502 family)